MFRAHFPACEGEGFPGGPYPDCPLLHPRQGPESDMLGALKHQMLVHLVQDCKSVMLL